MARLVMGSSGLAVNTSTYDKVAAITPLSIHFIKDSTGKIICANNIIDLDGATDIYEHLLNRKYMNNNIISGEVDFSSLEQLSQGYALQESFKNCPNITSVRFDNLLRIYGVEYVCRSAFEDCTSLETVNFDSLIEISGWPQCGNMFKNCTSLESVSFPSLIILRNNFSGTFEGCTNLKHLYFPKLDGTKFNDKTSLSSMLTGVTGCTIHLPIDYADASSIPGYPDFGGTDTVVLLDQNIKVNINVNADAGTILYKTDGTPLTTQSTSYPTQITVCPGDHIMGISSLNGAHIFQYTFANDIAEGDNIDLSFQNFEFRSYTFYTAAREHGVEFNIEYKVTSKYINSTLTGTISTANTLYVADCINVVLNDCINGSYMTTGSEIAQTTPSGVITLDAYLLDIENKVRYDVDNFVDYLNPSISGNENFTIDTENNYLEMQKPDKSRWNGYESIALENITEDVQNLLVAVKGYVATNGYNSYGFVSIGTNAIKPTAYNLRDKKIPTGEGQYLLIQNKDTQNVMETHMNKIFDIDHQWNVLSLGYISQGMGKTSDDAFYIESIEVIPFSELSNQE